MKNIFMILGVFISLLLSACSFAGDKKQGNPDVKIDKNKEITTIKQITYDKLSNLTLEEKVAQYIVLVVSAPFSTEKLTSLTSIFEISV